MQDDVVGRCCMSHGRCVVTVCIPYKVSHRNMDLFKDFVET